MRRLMRQVIEGARDELRAFGERTQQERALSDEEQLARYVQLHRGRPGEIVRLARRMAPAGSDALTQAVRYENEMERRLARQEERHDATV